MDKHDKEFKHRTIKESKHKLKEKAQLDQISERFDTLNSAKAIRTEQLFDQLCEHAQIIMIEVRLKMHAERKKLVVQNKIQNSGVLDGHPA